MHNLTWLNLEANGLTIIPDTIGNLTNLRTLNLNSQMHDLSYSLTTIPGTIGNLTNLQVLNLGSNDLTNVPTSLSRLRNLRLLVIDSRALSDVGRKNWEGIKEELREASPEIEIVD